MTYPHELLEKAHKHGIAHRREVMASKLCGCFYCTGTFAPAEIEDWVHETSGPIALAPDPWTALCPKCAIDSVIGDASGLPVSDPEFLLAMHGRWFPGLP